MNKELERIAVLYHANCLDGFGAAYAAWKHLGDTASYTAVNYGEEIPLGLEDAIVYIVDFSYPPDKMRELVSVASSVVVIDHHKGFIDSFNAGDYDDIEFVVLHSNEKSGAVLTWEYFHGNDTVPQLLLHIQDRDLWQFKLPDTKEICAALRNERVVPRSFADWDIIVASSLSYLIEQGKAIQATIDNQVDQLVKCASNPEIDSFGYKVVLCNAPGFLASELGNALANKYPDCIAVICHTDYANGIIKHSLRSVRDVDCIPLAKVFGGGGHKNAAGFSIKYSDEGKHDVASEIER